MPVITDVVIRALGCVLYIIVPCSHLLGNHNRFGRSFYFLATPDYREWKLDHGSVVFCFILILSSIVLVQSSYSHRYVQFVKQYERHTANIRFLYTINVSYPM